MKRFMLFIGETYYPCGGMDDFFGDFDTLNEAIEAASRHFGREIEHAHPTERAYDWYQVWDTTQHPSSAKSRSIKERARLK